MEKIGRQNGGTPPLNNVHLGILNFPSFSNKRNPKPEKYNCLIDMYTIGGEDTYFAVHKKKVKLKTNFLLHFGAIFKSLPRRREVTSTIAFQVS